MLRNHRQFSITLLSSILFLLFSLLLPASFYLLPAIVGHAYAEEPAQPDSSILEQGKSLLKKGDYNGALSLLTEAASKEPENAVVYNYLGEAYFRLKMYSDAVDALKKAITLDPQYTVPHIGLGMVYEAMENSEAAMREFEEVLRIGESNPNAPEIRFARERLKRIEVNEHLRKGRELYGKGRFEEAIEDINGAISIDPANTSAHLLAGFVHRKLNKPRDAYDAFKKAIEIQPGNFIAHFNLGELHFNAGAFNEAIAEFSEVIKLAPNSREARDAELLMQSGEQGLKIRKYFEEASAMVKAEKFDVAEETFKKILELQPQNSFALYNIGVVYFKTSRFEDALNVLLKSIGINPKDVQTRYLLGSVYDKLGRYDEAITEFDTVAESKGEIEEVKKARERVVKLKRYVTVKRGVERIDLLIEGGDIEDALKEVEILLVEDDKNERAHLLLGRIQLKKGDTAKALGSVKRAISIKSDYWDAYILLGQVNETQRKYSEAADAYKAVMSGAPKTKQGLLAAELLKSITNQIHFERARGYMDKGDFEGALKEISSILAIAPDDPVALYNAGVLYFRLNLLGEAEVHLTKAVEKNPEYVQAYLQLGLVYQAAQRFDEAELEFNKVLSITDTGKEASIAKARLGIITEEAAFLTHMKEANRLMKDGDYIGAKEELDTVIAITPNNYVAYFQLSVVWAKMERYEDAINTLKRAVEIKPDYATAYLFMAQLYEKDGFFKEAKSAYRKASTFGEGTREGEMADVSIRRLTDWRLSGSMGHTIDSNISYGAKRRTGVSTGHGLSFTYGIYTAEKRKLTADISVNRSLSYASQLSGMNYEGGVKWNHKIRDIQSYGIDADYTYSTFEQTPSYKNFSCSINTSLNPGIIPTSLSLSYSYSNTTSFVNKASDMVHHTVSFSSTQNITIRDNITGSYSFSANVNKDPMGSNYANRSNNLSVRYSRIVRPGFSVGANYGISFIHYSNLDSTSLFTRFRRNLSQNIGVNMSYQLSEKVSLTVSASSVNAKTNLAVPTAEERQKLEDILAAPVPTVGGGYKKETVTMGISFAF